VTFRSRDIWQQQAPPGDISYSELYHWRTVAKWRGLTWEAFCDLDTDSQAGYIAEYECVMRLQTLEAEHQRKEQERKARQARMTARGKRQR
jgi:hypothetical protein